MNNQDIKKTAPWRLLLPFTLAASLLFSLVSISLTQIFLGLSFIIWLLILIKEKKPPSSPSFFWPLLVYAGLSLLASFFSVNPSISLKDSRELLLYLIVPIAFIGLSQEKALKIATLALFLSALASTLYSVLFYFLWAQPGERIQGFMGHYMTQAGLLLLFICLALSLFLFSRERWRAAWLAAFLLALFSLTLTMTRSAWVGFIVAFVFILLLYKPKALILVPVVLVLLYFLSPAPMKRRALSIFSLESYSNQQRIQYLKAGAKIIREFPLFGTGPDTVDMVFQNPKYGLSEEAKRNVHLHNNLVQIGAERGVPALLAWSAFIVWTFVLLFRLIKTRRLPFFPYAVAAEASLLALVTSGLFEYNFADSEITTLFLFLITIPFALKREEDTEAQKEGK